MASQKVWVVAIVGGAECVGNFSVEKPINSQSRSTRHVG